MTNINKPRGQVRDGSATEEAPLRRREPRQEATPVVAPAAEPTAEEVGEVELVRRRGRHILAAADSKNLLAHARRSRVDPVNVPLGFQSTSHATVAVAGDGADDPDVVRALRMFRAHGDTISACMTVERAQAIRQARADGATFARLAEDMHALWGADAPWSPPWNRIVGRALVKVAALTLGEDPLEEPWN